MATILGDHESGLGDDLKPLPQDLLIACGSARDAVSFGGYVTGGCVEDEYPIYLELMRKVKAVQAQIDARQ